MEGKKVLITGSTDGIGLHTAKELAKLGVTVLVHGRCIGDALLLVPASIAALQPAK